MTVDGVGNGTRSTVVSWLELKSGRTDWPGLGYREIGASRGNVLVGRRVSSGLEVWAWELRVHYGTQRGSSARACEVHGRARDGRARDDLVVKCGQGSRGIASGRGLGTPGFRPEEQGERAREDRSPRDDGKAWPPGTFSKAQPQESKTSVAGIHDIFLKLLKYNAFCNKNLQTFKNRMTVQSSIPCLPQNRQILVRKDTRSPVFVSVQHYSRGQDVEATEVPVGRRLGEEAGVHIHNGMSPRRKER